MRPILSSFLTRCSPVPRQMVPHLTPLPVLSSVHMDPVAQAPRMTDSRHLLPPVRRQHHEAGVERNADSQSVVLAFHIHTSASDERACCITSVYYMFPVTVLYTVAVRTVSMHLSRGRQTCELIKSFQFFERVRTFFLRIVSCDTVFAGTGKMFLLVYFCISYQTCIWHVRHVEFIF